MKMPRAHLRFVYGAVFSSAGTSRPLQIQSSSSSTSISSFESKGRRNGRKFVVDLTPVWRCGGSITFLPTFRARVCNVFSRSVVPKTVPEIRSFFELDQVTPEVETALFGANAMARELQQNEVTAEHVLVALVEAPDQVCKEVFESLGIDVARLRAEIAKISPPGEEHDPLEVLINCPFSDHMYEVFLQAFFLGRNSDRTQMAGHDLLAAIFVVPPNEILRKSLQSLSVDSAAVLAAINAKRASLNSVPAPVTTPTLDEYIHAEVEREELEEKQEAEALQKQARERAAMAQ